MEYNDWRDMYLLHSNSKEYKKKLEFAKNKIIECFELGIHNPTVMWSGGKDSTALMHLVNTIKHTPAISEKDDIDFPNELDYVKSTSNLFNWEVNIISPNVKLWDIIHEFDFSEDIHSKNTVFSTIYFYDLLKNEKKRLESKCAFIGLRSQESKGRKMNLLSNRHIYYNQQWKEIICQPISEWSAKDVFAYLFSNDIPIMDVYFKTKFVNSPEDIRKSWILPSAQTSLGQAAWLKYYYHDIYQKLAEINPILRTYV